MEGLSYRESTVILATVQSRKQLSYSSNMHSCTCTWEKGAVGC